ncbi:hypothetical protein, partial [Thermococcus sp. PK]|uniref:hypothetical protein n=1 Tax=Thermococcus sp. PK TaxID=913025 RepID=UPI0018DD5471
MFIVTFIRVFAEFFQVVVVIPRWDHRLKDPESVAFAILDVLADFESEGKLKNLPKSKKFPVKQYWQYSSLNNTTTYPSETPSTTAENSSEQTFTTQPSTTGRKAEPRRTDKPPPEKLQKLPYASTQADSTIITNKKGQDRSSGNNEN